MEDKSGHGGTQLPNQPSSLTPRHLNPRNHRRQREPDANQSNQRRRIHGTSANNNNNSRGNQNQERRYTVAISPFGNHVQFQIDNEGRTITVHLDAEVRRLLNAGRTSTDDLDGMSYEGLMELEESIGIVERGLPKETISSHLKSRVRTTSAEEETEICTICQDVYENKDKIGTLDCQHEYHENCITQWLVQMNACPICKRQGLKTMEENMTKVKEC
ncbi:hypothetical protein C5167_028356 [Papaver somniferum]|uniref:probable E3 ubiquitin-protein ligase ZFP1 n=1 Tax=Papaver somniferum TaxID=3469 RepID=UPI000E6FFF03|nr:probable E3 ubiquitin-protein ligase ZFP1 [Papaver somniferum]RZC92994.1 hypothetical protein C5167_028356 [Papaver somniferum]